MTQQLEGADARILADSVGDPARFAVLFERHGAAVHRFLARRLGADVADDLAAEVFLRAFQSRGRYDPRLPTALPWLYGIAGNAIAQHGRDEARRWRLLAAVAPEPPDHGHADDADERVSAQRQRAALVTGLLGLAERDREVLLLVAWEQLSNVEIAAALGIPAATVRTRLHRARRRLQAHLSEHGQTGGYWPLEEMLKHE